VRFEEGDIREIPYPDGSFDAAFAFAVLEHVKDPMNHELVIERTIENLRPWIRQHGLADDVRIDARLAESKTWTERPDAFFALTQFAAVGWI
jgi:hypothetical protein